MAQEVTDAMIDMLDPEKDRSNTITLEYSKEFVQNRRIAEALNERIFDNIREMRRL
jgi:hypothetical protein